jgi:hypothetical protein
VSPGLGNGTLSSLVLQDMANLRFPVILEL